MHAGRAFAESLRQLRDHSTTTLLTIGLLGIPSSGTTFLRNYLGSRLVSLIALPVTVVFGIWTQAAMVLAVRDYAAGTDPGVGGLLSKSASPRRLLSLLGVQVILFLLGTVAGLVSVVPVAGVTLAGLSGSGGDFRRMLSGSFLILFIFTVIFSVALLIFLLVVIALRYGLAGQVNVIEQRRSTESLARSRQMVSGRWGDLFLLYLMLFGAGLAGFFALVFPAGIIAASTAGPQPLLTASGIGLLRLPILPAWSSAMVALASLLFGTLITPITIGSLTNFYLAIHAEETTDD